MGYRESSKDQHRFSKNKNCNYWNIFRDLNDWKIVKTFSTSNSVGEVQNMNYTILYENQKDIADKIKIGDIAAQNVGYQIKTVVMC